MKRFPLLLILMCGLLLMTGTQRSAAQFTAKQGIAAAQKKAQDSLGSDVQLVYIATIGKVDAGVLTSTFRLDGADAGKAEAWGYVFRSPSKEQYVTYISVFGGILAIEPPVTIPLDLLPGAQQLDMTQTYSNSDQLVIRLKTDATFNAYRTAYPDSLPYLISLGRVPATDSVPLPGGFDVSQGIWTVTFPGGVGVTGMVCFVGAGDGTVYCQNTNFAAVPAEARSATRGTADLVVAPNPANGRTRVSIDLPTGSSIRSGVGVALYDATGRKVMDLTGEFAANDFRFVEFDAQQLPAGVYYVRAIGADWNGVKGVVVQK